MARPPRLTDEEILRRAREVFLERGFSARTRQISIAVGMTWGAIVLRFQDKQELFRQAMAGESPPHLAAASREMAADAGVPGLLDHVRLQLWRQWPQRLHRRLASTTEIVESEPPGLRDWLSAALQVHAGRGAVRSDLSAPALARMVLALLIGDVAQRYMGRTMVLPDDPVLIDGMVALLKGC
jgi:AcrR family transcriptional regulator